MTTDDAIERAMRPDVLRSELQRSLILIAFFVFFLTASTVMMSAGAGLMERIVGRSDVRGLDVVGICGMLVVQLAMVGYVLRLRATDRGPAFVVLALLTVAETAFMGAPLWVLAGFVGARDALGAPPTYFFLLLIILSPMRLDPRICVLTGVTAGLTYAAVAFALLPEMRAQAPDALSSRPFLHIGKSMIMVVGGVLAAYVTRTIRARQRRALQLSAERQRVVDLFGQHVSPEVVDKLLAQEAELPSETRHVCMLFLDIRGFTTFSEERPPAEVVAYLNRLFEPLVDVVTDNGGIINKFLGDGFMAVFGAPLTDGAASYHAIVAARAMVRAVDTLVATGAVPATRIGIGLHAGPATTGNVGSRRRKEYTIIGDTVNLAARIESLNKQFDACILASEAAWLDAQPQCAARGESIEAVAVGPVQVKGREEAVQVYRLG